MTEIVCPSCHYAKNLPGEGRCNLCGVVLEAPDVAARDPAVRVPRKDEPEGEPADLVGAEVESSAALEPRSTSPLHISRRAEEPAGQEVAPSRIERLDRGAAAAVPAQDQPARQPAGRGRETHGDPAPQFGEEKTLRPVYVRERLEGQPTDAQVVYAGDFALTYVLRGVVGKAVILTPNQPYTFGRGEGVDHTIDAKTVSRHHARIHWTGDPPVPELVDLESKNGVLVNDAPVRKMTLEDGDEIVIGPYVATLRVLAAKQDLEAQLDDVDREGDTRVMTARLRGEVRLWPMLKLLWRLEARQESGTLNVQARDKHGHMTMIGGALVSAAFGSSVGEEAVRSIALLREGRFTFSPRGPQSEPQSIPSSLGAILRRLEGEEETTRMRRPPMRKRPG
jgi:pSer/pThr/pTyr-binding forkhead associated (FHA) protein